MNRDKIIKVWGNAAWVDLPNAEHIVKLFDSSADTDHWSKVQNYATLDQRYLANIIAHDLLRKIKRDGTCRYASYQIGNLLVKSISYNTYCRILNPLSALIAYDDCAYLLYSDPEEVKLLIKLGSTPAILLYPACVVFKDMKIT